MADIQRPANDNEETIVIGQGRDEPAIDLVFRVIRRLSSVEQSGRRVIHAVVKISPRLDDQVFAARNLLMRALLTHSAVLGATELVLTVGEDGPGSLRMRLLELVEELVGESVGGSTGIRVQFGENTPRHVPESGTFACATPVSNELSEGTAVTANVPDRTTARRGR